MERKKQWMWLGVSVMLALFSKSVVAQNQNMGPVSPAISATTQAATTPPIPPTAEALTPVDKAILDELKPEGCPVGNIEAGKAKASVCAACHGVDGNSTVSIWPKISGQGDLYLIKELMEYRKGPQGHRFDPSMYAMVQQLTDRDIADLAAYFASQTMSGGAAKADLVALGEKIYRGGNLETGVPACAGCHGATGDGNNLARFPRLSGQHADYTMDQLKKFKAKTRSDDPNGIMRDISQRLSEDEMKAVSSYVSGLH